MIKLDDVFADLQLIEHRVRYLSFFLPFGQDDLDYCEFEYDYEVIPDDDNEDTYGGTVVFKVKLTDPTEEDEEYSDILNFALEGYFIGNKNELDNEKFENLLEINGLATLSQLTRSIIISTTSNFGMDSPVSLPMINIFELIKLKKESEKEIKK